mgnify:CR=1 FL=1
MARFDRMKNNRYESFSPLTSYPANPSGCDNDR